MCRLVLIWLIVSASVVAQAEDSLVAQRAAEFAEKIADEHPRLLLRPSDLPALRAYCKQLPDLPQGAVQTRVMLPPLEEQTLTPEPPVVKNGTPEGTRQWQAGFKAANAAGSWAQRYALAWLLTQDARYGREAERWLLHLSSWRMTRETYRRNDELFVQHLRPMIFAYDWAYGALSPAARITIERALRERLTILAEFVQARLGLTQAVPPDNSLSHPVRFVSTLGQGGLTLLHETPEAAHWLAWAYEYYLRRFPVWGGPTGGWAEGLHYWSTGMTQHQRFLEGMALLGFNAPLDQPFWRHTPYFGLYGLMPYPTSSFGDLGRWVVPSGSLRLLMAKFSRLNADPYSGVFALLFDTPPPNDFNYFSYDAIDTFLEGFRAWRLPLPEALLADLPQSRYFDDVGVVNMHSALGDSARDIMLGFRSSPQGSASHALADQNSFVINAFGHPLAINSGHREFYDSPHHVGWTRQTKSKNAILFGGHGQRIKDVEASGRIIRFVDGASFSFVTGDAQRAYAPHAERALRHVFFVDRRYFVLLDEMRVPEPVSFQWRLHAFNEMRWAPSRNEIVVHQGDARLTVNFLHPGPGALVFSQTDAFDPPVDPAWRARMPNEWHVTAETAPALQQEILSLLYPWRAGDGSAPSARPVAAVEGLALRLDTGDLVLMARESEKRIEADGWRLDGVAASVTPMVKGQRFALIGTTRFEGTWALFASRAANMEGVSLSDEFSLTLHVDAPMTVTIRPGFLVKDVNGANEWQREPDGGVRVVLEAGPARLVLRP